jgi:hypothetical protein
MWQTKKTCAIQLPHPTPVSTNNLIECPVAQPIKRAIVSGLSVTPKRVKQSLIKDAGAQFTLKNQHVLDLMRSEKELYRPPRDIPFTIISKDNKENTFRVLLIFKNFLTKNLKENHIQTNH